MSTVEVLATAVVRPAEETPAGAIWLSNLDLAARRGYMPTVYFYRPNGGNSFTASAVMDSLSRALVPFYPLAGHLGLDGAGRLQIECTGEGAVFVTARSDHYVLDDLVKEFVPCGEMRDLFVPAEPAPGSPRVLLMAQVTRLRCGGVVLGTALHHSAVDARSAAHFLLTWASFCRASCSGGAAPPVTPPCFDHALLGARPTRAVLYDHPEYKGDAAVHGAAAAAAVATTTSSAFITVSTQQVSALKARCEGATTFRAVAALVWRCACRARALPADAETRLYTMVDMRPRLEPPLPRTYFGNAVVRTSAVATVREVVSNPVGYGARLARAMTNQGDEYARSVVDYLEGVDAMKLPASCMSRAHLRAISWMGMSLTDADFGWGEPVFIAPALTYYSSSVYVMNAPGKDGAIALAVTLEPESMPDFKLMLAHELSRLQQAQ